MSQYQYFDELSAGGNSLDEDCSSGSIDDVDQLDSNTLTTTQPRNGKNVIPNNRNYRLVLHADVDCFYCQCEVLDKHLDPKRPIAIGQKHIIVTCNYVARSLGITKLMNRIDAQIVCPNLLIIDGSDLQRYRIYGRQIYESFRRAMKFEYPQCHVRKGCMDEMMAEIILNDVETISRNDLLDIYVYNDAVRNKSIISLTEDQSGAQTFVSNTSFTTTNSMSTMPIVHDDFLQKLHHVAHIALKVRQRILDETGFTTTMGVSYNPMMAKVASGLHKPGTVNVMEPCVSSQQLIASMPLRKIPGIGSRTMKMLIPCLEKRHGIKSKTTSSPWICRDLLCVPPSDIIDCLKNVQGAEKSSSDQCAILLSLCSGCDDSIILDDEGCLQKSLSVENSLRSGTIRTKDQVLVVMEDLYRRLPLLLKDRIDWSDNPALAYPTLIRLTARSSFASSGGNQYHNRRFTTRSQQAKIDGQSLCNTKLSSTEKSTWLRQKVSPLLQSLLFNSGELNVTRINICLSNFQDTLKQHPLNSNDFFSLNESPKHLPRTHDDNDSGVPAQSDIRNNKKRLRTTIDF